MCRIKYTFDHMTVSEIHRHQRLQPKIHVTHIQHSKVQSCTVECACNSSNGLSKKDACIGNAKKHSIHWLTSWVIVHIFDLDLSWEHYD